MNCLGYAACCEQNSAYERQIEKVTENDCGLF
jgi:hypothetical protein